MNELRWMAKVQALQAFAIVTVGRHPDYVLEKAGLLDNPKAFGFLSDTNMEILDDYFEKWGYSDVWNNYKMQVQKDYWDISVSEFHTKYIEEEEKCNCQSH